MQIVKTTIRNGHQTIDKEHILIDPGHYQDGAIDGHYMLQLIKPIEGELGWENSEKFNSKNRFEIRTKLELLMEQYQSLSLKKVTQ